MDGEAINTDVNDSLGEVMLNTTLTESLVEDLRINPDLGPIASLNEVQDKGKAEESGGGEELKADTIEEVQTLENFGNFKSIEEVQKLYKLPVKKPTKTSSKADYERIIYPLMILKVYRTRLRRTKRGYHFGYLHYKMFCALMKLSKASVSTRQLREILMKSK